VPEIFKEIFHALYKLKNGNKNCENLNKQAIPTIAGTLIQ